MEWRDGRGGGADTRFTASTSYYLPLSDFPTGSTHLFSFLATFILHTSYCLYLKSNWRKSPPILSSHPFCLHQTSTTRPFFLQQLAEVCSRWSTAPPPALLHPPDPPPPPPSLGLRKPEEGELSHCFTSSLTCGVLAGVPARLVRAAPRWTRAALTPR